MTASVTVIAMLLAGATVDAAVPPTESGVQPDAQAEPVVPETPAPVITAPVITAPPPVVPTLPATEIRGEIRPEHGSEPGEIVVRARVRTPSDPLQEVNAKSFAITQAVDEAIIRPVALTYQKILPDPVRSGIRNIINNLREPVVFLNFLLQLKPGKAVETAARFAINSTVGIAGTFDFAKRKPINLPRRPNGLGNTLGYYGVKPGPFLFLPILGPTSLRDLFADTADRLVLPTVVGKPFNKLYVAIPIGLFSSLDQRAEYDETLMAQRETADPYVARREEYLARRQAAIDALHSPKWRDAHPRRVKGAVPVGK